MTNEEQHRSLTATRRFAAGLKSMSFLVVLSDFQIYHRFQVVQIPEELMHPPLLCQNSCVLCKKAVSG